MPRPLRKLLVLLSIAASAVALSGCVAINSTGSFQLESMGPVTLSVSGCSSGSPGCTGQANTGSIYGFLEGSPGQEVKIQMLLAVRLPEGSTPPANLLANLPGGGLLAFAASPSYVAELQTLEPAPAGERWWGWVSGVFAYSFTSKQSFDVQLTATLPRPADGGPYESPMHWRPVLGARVAEKTLPPTRPVKCGTTNLELYEGFAEEGSGDTVVCADSPSPAATRGFIVAGLADFGILGTAVQAPTGSTVTAPFIAKRSGPADPGTTLSLAAQGGVPGGTLSIDRTAVSLGGDSAQPVLATIGVPANAPPGNYPVTLTATASGKPTRTGTAVVTVTAPGKPLTLKASLSNKRFRVGKKAAKAKKGAAPIGTKLNLTLSEKATLAIATSKRNGKKWKALGTTSSSLPAGDSAISIRGKIGKIKLKPGKYRLVLTAKSDSGSTAAPATIAFTVAPG